MHNFLKTEGTKIIKPDGRTILLKGVNLGGWLLMEGYILHSPNIAERTYKRKFSRYLGPASLKGFSKDFRDHFITEYDFKTIAHYGFNCIRVPFHYRLVEDKPFSHKSKDIHYLDSVIRWAEKYRLYVILDLHAACGAQNHDWHSDSLGQALLWEKKSCQERTISLWEFLADRYKDEEHVAGYDVLNEAVLGSAHILNKFYKQLIERIRKIDRHHILFIEGNKWATDLECLEEFNDDNLVLSIHMYLPLEFTFNFVPQLSYPFHYQGHAWNHDALKRHLAQYEQISQKRSLPIFVGEFGVNNRDGLYKEDQWVKDVLACFKEFGFHWTYWTYKAVKNNIFPDGLFSYMDNPPWVNRQGPQMGFATYPYHWPKQRKAMINSWRTDSFKLNTKILKSLTDAAH